MGIGTRFVLGYQTVFVDGEASPGALVYFYETGTSTPANTYSDSTLDEANPNPVVADANGLLPNIFLDPTVTYKVVITDSAGANQTTADPVSSNVAAVASGLELGTASTKNVGTAGANLGLLNANLTFSGVNQHTGAEQFSGGLTLAPAGAAFGSSLAGYLGIPVVPQAASYTLELTDSGVDQLFSATCTATIPANAAVPFPIGTFVVLSWEAGAVGTVAITADTLRWPVGNVTGARTVTGPGFLVATKKLTTEWWVTGGVNIT